MLPTYIDVCHSRHWCRCERNVSKHLPAARQKEPSITDDSWLTYLAWPLFLEDIIIITITMTKKIIMDITMYVIKKRTGKGYHDINMKRRMKTSTCVLLHYMFWEIYWHPSVRGRQYYISRGESVMLTDDSADRCLDFLSGAVV